MRLSCNELIELSCGPYTATVAPTAGGRITSLVWSRAGTKAPLLVEWNGNAFDEHDWPKAGAFPMLPFANRLPRGGFCFGGRSVRPEPGPAGFALHGFAHRRTWSVVEATAHRAVMRYTHDSDDADWPWTWSAEQAVELGEGGMTVALSVTNQATEPMPLAMGWHPYHPVPTDMACRDLEFFAGARHELDEEGRASAHAKAPRFAMRRGETAAFTQWTGGIRLRSTESGATAVSCQGTSHLVLHRPASGNYVCIEPITLLPGRLGGQPEPCGMGVLQAGQTQQLTWTCGFVPASADEDNFRK